MDRPCYVRPHEVRNIVVADLIDKLRDRKARTMEQPVWRCRSCRRGTHRGRVANVNRLPRDAKRSPSRLQLVFAPRPYLDRGACLDRLGCNRETNPLGSAGDEDLQ